jgi:hypothetical protein
VTELARSVSTTIEGVVETGDDFQPLLDAAVATVYRTNAFRTIGLPVDASARDIAHRSERLRMPEKHGSGASGAEGPLALDPPPDRVAIREALRRLRDPERRLVEELFWFWPMDAAGYDDPALLALTDGDTTTAVQIWRDRGGIGAHNLAVLFHAAALDLELSSGPLTADAQKRRDRCWRESFSSWKVAIDDEECWSRLAARIRQLENPRLTAGTGPRIRAALPRTLLSISARLAVSAADRQAYADSDRHMKCIGESGFGAGAREQALRLALAPLRERVLAFCQLAEPDAKASPEHADQVAIRLLDSTAPPLAAFTLLRKGDPTRESLHDEVALRALACQIAYGNKTEDWDGSLALLNRILTVAVSASARTRVEGNLEIIKLNIEFKREFGICWFCGQRKPVEAAEAEVKMHGNVTRTPTNRGVQVNWSLLTVKIPRCPTCQADHASADHRPVLVFLVGALIGFASCAARGVGSGGAGLGIAGLVLGIVLGVITKRMPRHGVKPLANSNRFPAVLRKKKEGWTIGEKPSGVQ